ncbi:Uncharacterised protein g58 [Pycnogonum litorale]
MADEDQDETVLPTFKEKTVEEIMKLQFTDKVKTKVNGDALKVFTEVLQIFVHEGAVRAAKQAKQEAEKEVKLEQLEKVLPQLMMDF